MKSKLLSAVFLLSVFVSHRAYGQGTQVQVYILPHVANGTYAGGSFRTTFILFNNNDSDVSGGIELKGDIGNPLPMAITGSWAGPQSYISFNLKPGMSQVLQTDGTGNLVSGSAAVIANSRLGVSAIFSVYDTAGRFVTEAGVGSSDHPTHSFTMPVDTSGPFNTGLAITSFSDETASVTFKLLDTTGKEISRTTRDILFRGHLASFVSGKDQLFPTAGNFRGILEVQSASWLLAVALRQYDDGSRLSYTSLPVVEPSAAQANLILAHVANGSYDGGSFRTMFLIFNPSTTTANVSLVLTKDDGTPLPVTIPGSGTNSTFIVSIAAGGSVFLQTDGSGRLTSGAANITSDVPIGASGIFSVFDLQGKFQTETGVGASPPLSALTLPVDVTGSFDTGIAFFNPGAATARVILRIMDSTGLNVGPEATISVPPRNHTAQFVSQIFPGLANFRGSLAISVTGSVAAMTLRQNTTPLSYTTLPVAAGLSLGIAPPAPLLPKTARGIAATANVSLDQTLSAGYKISGKVIGWGWPGTVEAHSSTGEVFTCRVDFETGKYLVVVGPGTYTLKVGFNPEDWEVGILYTDPGIVQVSGDVTRDITLPSKIDLHKVNITFGGKPPGEVFGRNTVLSSTDNKIFGFFDQTTPRVPAGNYLVSREMMGFILFNLGTVTVGETDVTADLPIPRTARLSGKIDIGNGTAPSEAQLSIVDETAPKDRPTWITSTIPIYNAGQYGMDLMIGRNYSVSASIPSNSLLGINGFITFPQTPAITTLSGDAVLDFNLQLLPGYVTVSGRVTDASGQGLKDVTVAAFSESLTGVPNVGFSSDTTTDPNGNYRISVVSGNNYQLTFTPPLAKPPLF